MPSTNGHGLKQAILYVILYARVSTDEQARSGYSLAQQMEALREYAACEGYEILEEVIDPGQSGASLERPGMDRVRDLVAGGGVSIVLAQDRDRFAREPAYLYLLKKEFEEHGTKLRSLNDRGDDSPEGQFTDDVLDVMAKFERAKTTERTRRGKLQKAREGKIFPSRRATYGFKFNDSRDGYVVDEREMEVVRRIFYMVGAEGRSLHSVKRALEDEGIPSPMGKKFWNQTYIRGCVLGDAYRPHTFEELRELLSPAVASGLDEEKSYGIWWFNRHRTKLVRRDGKKKQFKSTPNERHDWIAVPVPDSGIPRELVDAARTAIKDNRPPSRAGRRFWELSGGIILCADCGRRMRGHRSNNRLGREYFYYVCPLGMRHETCAHRKAHRGEKTEAMVWEFVSGLLTDAETLRADLERMIELEREGTRGDPEREAKAWADKLAEVDRKRDKYQEAFAADAMTLDELRPKLAALEETRKTAKRELEAVRDRKERLESLERDKDTLLEHYATLAPEALDSLTPEERHELYKMLRIEVAAYQNGALEISGAFSEDLDVLLSENNTKVFFSRKRSSSRRLRSRSPAKAEYWMRTRP